MDEPVLPDHGRDEMKYLKDQKYRSARVLLCILLICAALIVYKFCFARRTPMQVARANPSETGWVLVCDTQEHNLTIFKQDRKAKEGEWKPRYYNSFPCTTGAITVIEGKERTCTPMGLSHIHWKQRKRDFDDSRSWYNCWTERGFGIHSTMYALNEDEPLTEVDGRLGIDTSTGCIRVEIGLAKFLYKKIPLETPLIVY